LALPLGFWRGFCDGSRRGREWMGHERGR
jgi:hypothetical protein